ncbi:MAG: hypothetical protein ACO1RX_22000 [Candidatus Sericytochromatia bacterium]
MWKSVVSTLLVLSLTLPVMAAQNRTFSAMELGVAVLDPVSLTEAGGNQAEAVFAQSDQLLAGAGLQGTLKPLGDTLNKIRLHVTGLSQTQSQGLQPHLKPYQTLDSAPLGYEAIDLPQKAELRALVEQANDLLKQADFVSAAVTLDTRLLPQLRSDAASLKGNDPVKKAALGLVGASLVNLTVGASQRAQKIAPSLQALSTDVKQRLERTQATVTAQPFQALGLAEDVAVLTRLSTALVRATGDLGKAGTQLPGLLGELQGVVSGLI